MWNANTHIDEDCLYLNIWVPKHNNTKQVKEENKLAVMVWIYGGGFYSGTSTLDIYDGRMLASENNVIVVSIQYRVGAFGLFFLGKGFKDAPGNMAIWDQIMALSWINDNIEGFGGDTSRITIFGESAGAASVGLLMLTPFSQRLFNNAILQSSSPFSPWALRSASIMQERSIKLAHKCGCVFNKDQLEIMAECMRNVEASLILSKEPELVREPGSPAGFFLETPFSPVFDNYCFPGFESLNFLRLKPIKRANILLGVNRDEGTYFMAYGMNGMHINGLNISPQSFTMRDFDV